MKLQTAEAKLGELLKPLTELPHRNPDGTYKDSLPSGISKKQSHYAQELAGNMRPLYFFLDNAN